MLPAGPPGTKHMKGRPGMTDKNPGRARFLIYLFILALLAAPCAAKGSAMIPAPAGEELLKALPGRWTFTDDPAGPDAALEFKEDGGVSLAFYNKNGDYLYACEGTYTFRAVPEQSDILTLEFISTDDPARAGGEYDLTCVYGIYAEAWIDQETMYTALIFEETLPEAAEPEQDPEQPGQEQPIPEDRITTPFEDAYDYNGAVLYQIREPNMVIANCRSYASLRAKRSKRSTRLLKIPVGSEVLAFPEDGYLNGFVLCAYHDELGYILKQYLRAIE